MAPIEEISRRHREYACGVCNMHITFEAYSMAIGGENLVQCGECRRILYVADEKAVAKS